MMQQVYGNAQIQGPMKLNSKFVKLDQAFEESGIVPQTEIVRDFFFE